MSDEDIIRTEKHFQENKVTPSDFAAAATLNVNSHLTDMEPSNTSIDTDLLSCY